MGVDDAVDQSLPLAALILQRPAPRRCRGQLSMTRMRTDQYVGSMERGTTAYSSVDKRYRRCRCVGLPKGLRSCRRVEDKRACDRGNSSPVKPDVNRTGMVLPPRIDRDVSAASTARSDIMHAVQMRIGVEVAELHFHVEHGSVIVVRERLGRGSAPCCRPWDRCDDCNRRRPVTSDGHPAVGACQASDKIHWDGQFCERFSSSTTLR